MAETEDERGEVMSGIMKCFNGHKLNLNEYKSNKETIDKVICPECGERMYPDSWFESARACVNVLTVGRDGAAKINGKKIIHPVFGECMVKKIPYLDDAVEICYGLEDAQTSKRRRDGGN